MVNAQINIIGAIQLVKMLDQELKVNIPSNAERSFLLSGEMYTTGWYFTERHLQATISLGYFARLRGMLWKV